ncbi:MAG: 4-hydroxybutyrate CoA-transferase [Oligoflexia bacterium]|nr:MAG: 4-hydroxybutyrate CoA-transferase [Oligoflexia bacterium]
MGKIVSLSEAISKVQSNKRVFIHGGAATPKLLVSELMSQAKGLKNIEVMHLHTHGEPVYAKPEYKETFRVANLFVGANMRPYLDMDRVDYLPCFLSEISSLFTTGRRKPDVALIHVSPPDRHGFCSLGTSVDVARAAVDTADLVIAQVNPNMPRIHGDGNIHESKIHFMVECHEPMDQVKGKPLTSVELEIGKHAASLIEDGATLQMGIGSIPDAVLASLKNHKNLGIHTEMWSDGALELIQKGIVNNSKKSFHRGKTTAAFVMGTQKLYDFVNDNPAVILLEAGYVNNPRNIARNKRVTAINSAVEIDLTGQVCADSIGSHIISGVGGQIDFIRGASLSEGGKPIIALPSRTNKGLSRIVTQLKQGAGVVTTRAHVHFVVTEYGAADLFGKTIHERALALIDIAHPDDREKLSRDWHELVRNTCHR